MISKKLLSEVLGFSISNCWNDGNLIVWKEDGAFIVTCEDEFCNAFEWISEEVIGNIYEHSYLLNNKKE